MLLPGRSFVLLPRRTIVVMDGRPRRESAAPLPSYRLDALETTQQESQRPSLLGQNGAPDPVTEPTPECELEVGIIFRHSGWQSRRNCVDDAIGGLDESQKRLDRFRSCGRNCWVLRCVGEPGLYRVSCDKCKDRFCDPCARERANHVASCVGEFAEGKELRLITLTLRKSDRTLSEDVDFLYRSFTRLRRRKLWSRGQRGGVYFIEIKRRRGDDGWHVHLHVLAEGTFINKQSLSKTWHEITGDSFIVDVKFCESGVDAARYVAKYASKGVHGSCYHDADVLRTALRALKGRRLVGKFGNWRELSFDQEPLEGEWFGVDSLRRLLLRRDNGDAEATMIIASLVGEKSCSTVRSDQPDPGG